MNRKDNSIFRIEIFFKKHKYLEIRTKNKKAQTQNFEIGLK
jgi:hypothetical protein